MQTKKFYTFHQHSRHQRASCEEILCAISFAWLFCCFQFVVTDVLYVFRKLRKCKVINMSWSFYNWWLCFCCHVLSLPLCEIFIKPSRKDKIVICSSTHTILWTKQNVKMGRLLETSRVPQKSCGKPVYLYNISFNLSRGHLLYSKDTFFLNSHRWYAHKKVVVYMAYVIELLKHILSKELKNHWQHCWNEAHGVSYLPSLCHCHSIQE